MPSFTGMPKRGLDFAGRGADNTAMDWTIPNILTLARLAAAPLIAFVYLLLPSPAADLLAFVLFVTAAATDFLDGYLARRWNQLSEVGRVLDPIADKAMVVIALAVLMGAYGFAVWLVVPAALILFREVSVSGLREALGDRAVALKVTPLAKWKTTFQMVAIGLLFLAGALPWDWLLWFGGALLWVAGALTVLTGWDYATKAITLITTEGEPR